MFSINYLAVAVSLVVYTILGMLWYGVLFGKKWAILAGMADKDMNTPEMKKAQTTGYISSLISGFIALLSLAILMKASGIDGAINGLLTGAGVGFGFIAMTLVGEAAWHDTPWALVGINSGYRICGLAIGGLIIGLW
jgi:hypothetical protein